MKKLLIYAIVTALLFVMFCECINAGDYGLDSFKESIPSDIADLIPDDAFSEDAETSAAAVAGVSGFGFFADYISRLLFEGFPDAVSLLFSLLGMLILCGAVKLFAKSIKSPSVAASFELCTSFSFAAIVFKTQFLILSATEEYLTRLGVIMGAMIPVMSTVYAAGGNISSASVNGCGMLIFLEFSELVLSDVLLPLVKFCYALSFAGLISGSLKLGGLSAIIRKTSTFAITFVASVIGAVMAFQNVLSQSADNAASRIVKFSLGSFIPIVGSALSDTVKTLSSGLTRVKNSTGVLGIVLIILIALPPLIAVFLHKFSLGVAAAFSDMLGCEKETGFLSEVASLQNMIVAVICISALVFVFSVSTFIASTLVVGA